MFLPKDRTSFSSYKVAGVSPAQGRASLAVTPPQQSLGCVLDMEGALVLDDADEPLARCQGTAPWPRLYEERACLLSCFTHVLLFVTP